MRIAHNINEIPPPASPVALTIGSFDGVHLGHRFLIEQLRSSMAPNGTCALLTFSNHPSEILPFLPKTKQLCSIEQKIELLEKAGIDLLLLIPFTQELAATAYDHFLRELYAKLPFSHLILGKGASFGKGGCGTEDRVRELAPTIGFAPYYLEKKMINGERVSSGLIRNYLEKGDFKNVRRLLGRPYSLSGRCEEERLPSEDLCLPPPGRYPLMIKAEGQTFPGWASIDKEIRLECQKKLSGCKIEAIFI